MKSGHLASFLLAILAGVGLSIFPITHVSAAQDDRGLRQTQALLVERRIALVIGNAAYKDGPLLNPANDARDMAATIRLPGLSIEQVFKKVRVCVTWRQSVRAVFRKAH